MPYLPPQRPVIDEIASAVGFRLHAIVEDGPECPERRADKGITIILFTADSQVKHRCDRERIVQTFGDARRGCPTGNPGLKIGYRDRDTGEDRKLGCALKPRARKENIGAGAILQPTIKAAQQQHGFVKSSEVERPGHGISMAEKETKLHR